jgi:RimJ/RimL family protein N-acetyltransferase
MVHEGHHMTFIDKSGERFELTDFSGSDQGALRHMYDCFSPKPVTQGLPPANDRARAAWITGLIENGENFLAWQGGKVVGHSSLVLEPSGQTAEYIIFVDRQYRNRGLGTALTRLTIDRAREMRLLAVWLTVETFNFKAIRLYKKIGFEFSHTGECERAMTLVL